MTAPDVLSGFSRVLARTGIWRTLWEMTEGKVPAESNRKKMQRLQTDDALTLFDAGKLRVPSDARLAEPDVYGRPQAHQRLR
jgi:hypothetical protein